MIAGSDDWMISSRCRRPQTRKAKRETRNERGETNEECQAASVSV